MANPARIPDPRSEDPLDPAARSSIDPVTGEPRTAANYDSPGVVNTRRDAQRRQRRDYRRRGRGAGRRRLFRIRAGIGRGRGGGPGPGSHHRTGNTAPRRHAPMRRHRRYAPGAPEATAPAAPAATAPRLHRRQRLLPSLLPAEPAPAEPAPAPAQ